MNTLNYMRDEPPTCILIFFYACLAAPLLIYTSLFFLGLDIWPDAANMKLSVLCTLSDQTSLALCLF